MNYSGNKRSDKGWLGMCEPVPPCDLARNNQIGGVTMDNADILVKWGRCYIHAMSDSWPI